MAKQREPLSLIEAKGKKHLTKAEKEERQNTEVKASNDNILAPSYLTDELKAEFDKYASELIKIGIMSNLDCGALARYVVSENEYQKVTTKILKSKSMDDKYLMLLNVQEKLFKMCRSSASDLGLTISSRCKLVIPKKEEVKEKTKAEKLFGGSL